MNKILLIFIVALWMCSCSPSGHEESTADKYPNFSGVYPHLAFYNSQGECGTGAVVPWAGKLWAVTYSPHFPDGSDDKLYEINQDLDVFVRSESIGGTPANRMIHKESNQLFIGPYAINEKGIVRAIPYETMPGRHTGNARHLTDPDNKIYFGTMEEGFYEVDTKTLAVKTLYQDGNKLRKAGEGLDAELLPGAHGKGLYSGQGVLVYSNNGEAGPEALKKFDIQAGVLAEWDGNDWEMVRRNQFVEVTGPGGIYGNGNFETDPIWATGFDHKSAIVGVRDAQEGWSFFRLPKASHSYDGAHGWNTEWPRIRNIGQNDRPDYLMTMHGMFWEFPSEFSATQSGGIRPRSSYIKVIGDFTRWNDRLVFGCDDSAQKEFLNKRKVKGNIEGPGQSNSNLWFTSLQMPDLLGPNTACGSVWMNEPVQSQSYSEPFLFSGWQKRSAWIKNHGTKDFTMIVEVDRVGGADWQELLQVVVKAGESKRMRFSENEHGEWIRAKIDVNAVVSLEFTYADEDKRGKQVNDKFTGLSGINSLNKSGGLLYGLGSNKRALGISAQDQDGSLIGYYELDSAMQLSSKQDATTQHFIEQKFAIPKDVISVEKSSVLVIDDSGRRWRLPKGNVGFDHLIGNAETRICREVATERDLFNCHGTFYELPAENADGFAKIRPIASHDFRIHDYASFRGLLIMTGIEPDAPTDNMHIVKSEDGKMAIWAGVIDDLWNLAKPVGTGGPLLNDNVRVDIPSDPYLIGFYDDRKLSLSHDNESEVEFTLEVNPIGHGPWMTYKKVKVSKGETMVHEFPSDFEARWIRIVTDKDCNATAWFEYN